MSTLALGSLMALISIVFGCALTLKMQYYLLDDMPFFGSLRRLDEIRDRLTRCCWYANEFDCVSWRSHWRTSSIPAPNIRHSFFSAI
jgi:hypothetical protein